jgi:PII-like signaling protein
MPEQRPGKRLTIFVGELDRFEHRPLADAILERARAEGLAGASIFRGIEGFGPSGRLKTARLLSSSDDLPMLIHIVDEAPRIEAFLLVLDGMMTDGLAVVEDVDIRMYHHAGGAPAS